MDDVISGVETAQDGQRVATFRPVPAREWLDILRD
jgi:hypothetical protein